MKNTSSKPKNSGNFANDPERARAAGRKGGQARGTRWICGKCEEEKMGKPEHQQLPKHSRHCTLRS